MEIILTSCRLRSWRSTDEASLIRHAGNERVWRNLRDRFPHPCSQSEARRWLGAATTQVPERVLAIEVEGQAAGGIGLELQSDVYRRSAEIGFWLGEPFWGRGIATEAVSAFTANSFERFDLVRIFARVFEWNPASARVLIKCGYIEEGRLRRAVLKNGQILDELIFAVLRPEPMESTSQS